MEKLQILLNRFREGVASDLEKKELLEALAQNEEALKQKLNAAFGNMAPQNSEALSKEESQEVFRLIQANKEPAVASNASKERKPLPVIKPVVKWLAAASIAGLVFLAVHLFNSGKNYAEADKVNTAYAIPAVKMDTVTNTSHAAFETVLEDGTVVRLEANSTIIYPVPFAPVKREVSLIGKATFAVAKNKTKSFTVMANGVATTALGTKFTIDASDKNDIQVRLLEGKVVVKLEQLPPSDAGTFLLPGEQFRVNMQTLKYAKTKFRITESDGAPTMLAKENTGKNTKGISEVLHFNNTPLNEVFDKISKRYQVPVRYHKREVQGLPFTGSFMPGDSLEVVLGILCNTNDLNFKQAGNVWYITK